MISFQNSPTLRQAKLFPHSRYSYWHNLSVARKTFPTSIFQISDRTFLRWDYEWINTDLFALQSLSRVYHDIFIHDLSTTSQLFVADCVAVVERYIYDIKEMFWDHGLLIIVIIIYLCKLCKL